MTIKYRIKGRKVQSPKGRLVVAELWRGNKRVKVLGKVRSKAAGEKLSKEYGLRTHSWISSGVVSQTKHMRWDVAAEKLSKEAIKGGLKKGGWYQLEIGTHRQTVKGTAGGSSLRSISARRKKAKSLAEEITAGMFRLGKLYLHKARIDSNTFHTLKLEKFRLRQIADHLPLPNDEKGLGRSIRKTILKATPSSAVSRGGKTKRKPKRKRQTVTFGKTKRKKQTTRKRKPSARKPTTRRTGARNSSARSKRKR